MFRRTPRGMVETPAPAADEGDGPGMGLIIGLFVFLIAVGLVGWHTRPVAQAYPHQCRHYELDDDEDEDWEEGYVQPVAKPGPAQKTKAGGGLKAGTDLKKQTKDAIDAVVAKRLQKRVAATPKPAPKPKPALKPAAAAEHFSDALLRDKKKIKFTVPEVQVVRTTQL